MDSDIFTLVKEQDEKVKLWQDLTQSKGEILAKGQDEAICRMRAVYYNSKTQLLECIFESALHLKSGEEYLGHFFLGGEKYYFQANAQVEQNKISISIPKELYHLQRRQNYRVHIPANYPAFLKIVTVNSKPHKIEGKLADLSSQGCRFTYNVDSTIIKVGDALAGTLIIDKNESIDVQGLVRHIKTDENNKAMQSCGVEFTPITSALESRLFALTLEIHKQLFRRPA